VQLVQRQPVAGRALAVEQPGGAVLDWVRAATSPGPPGTTTMSGRWTCSSECSTSSVSMPLSVLTGPGSAATNATLAPGRRLSTSYGPMASSAVNLS
jgi:hypothetical protein